MKDNNIIETKNRQNNKYLMVTSLIKDKQLSFLTKNNVATEL